MSFLSSFNLFTRLPLTSGMLSQSGLTTFNAAACVDGVTDDNGSAHGTQTSTTLKDTAKIWLVNTWTGSTVTILSGLGSGQTRTVSSNTVDTLTISVAWTTTPDTTSVYSIAGRLAWSTGSASVGAWLQIDLGATPASVQMIRLSPPLSFGSPGDYGRGSGGVWIGFPAVTCLYV